MNKLPRRSRNRWYYIWHSIRYFIIGNFLCFLGWWEGNHRITDWWYLEVIAIGAACIMLSVQILIDKQQN
jgi:hypothetical protein